MSENLDPANEGAWERLETQIKLSDGSFGLYFLFSRSLRPLSVFSDRVWELFRDNKERPVLVHPTQPSGLFRALEALTRNELWAKAPCVWLDLTIMDSPGSASRSWHDALEQFFLRLNERRDALRESLRGFVVIALHPDIKALVREAAPDLWSVRTIVVELEAEMPARATTSLLLRGDPSKMAPLRDYLAPTQPGPATPSPAPDADFAMAEAHRRKARPPPEIPPSDDSRFHELEPPPDVPVGQALLQAAEGYLAKGDLAQAQQVAQAAHKHLRGADLLGESMALYVLAQCEYGLGRFDDAANHIKIAISRRKKSDRTDIPASWYDLGGMVLFAKNQLEQAKTYYTEAITRAHESVDGRALTLASAPLSRELSTYLKHLGEALFLSGDTASALQVFEEALILDRALAELLQVSPRDREAAFAELAFSLTRMGDLQLERGDQLTGIAAYEESLSIHRQIARAANIDSLRNLSIALNRLGRAWLDAGNLANAMPLFEESAVIRRNIIRRIGKTPERLLELLSSLSKLGMAAQGWENVSRAESCYNEMFSVAHELQGNQNLKEKANEYKVHALMGLIRLRREQDNEEAAQRLEVSLANVLAER